MKIISILMLVLGLVVELQAALTNGMNPVMREERLTKDLAVVDLVPADTGCFGVENIVITVRNLGTETATGFSVTFRVNATIPILHAVSATLQPGETREITFSSKFDFTSPGAYLLEGWVELDNDEMAANDTMVNPVFSREKPQGSFQTSLGCTMDSLHFTDQSTHTEGISARQWFVGTAGNMVASGEEADIFFPIQEQWIGLIVTANNGCVDTVTQQVSAYPKPVAGFTADAACEGSSVQFENLTQITNDTIENYKWDFGDGNTSGNDSPSHTFANSGSFQVRLTAVSGNGCTDSFESQVQVHPKPSAAFGIDGSYCHGDTVEFTDQTTINTGSISKLLWDFGNGEIDSGTVVASEFEEGNYVVTHVAVSDQGCGDTAVKNVSVAPLPVAAFAGTLTGCVLDTFLFTNESVVSAGTISSYYWEFGDGETSTEENPEHAFQSSGVFDVQLEVTSQAGCRDDTTRIAEVFAIPSKPVIQRVGDTLFVTTSGNYQWYLDGNPITGETDSFLVVQQAGSYSVRLTIAGCSSISDAVVVVGLKRGSQYLLHAQIYPNPASEWFRIDLTASVAINATLELWSADGRMLKMLEVLNNVKEWQGKYSLEGRGLGTYFIVLNGAGKGKTKVWPIQKVR